MTMPRRHVIGTRIVAALFAFLAFNAWNELVSILSGSSDGPPTLAVLQGLVGTAAAATAVGAWIGARWAPALAALYGVIAAVMIVALGPLLDMPFEERDGLWIGGGVVLLFALACAAYLRWAFRRSVAGVPAGPT